MAKRKVKIVGDAPTTPVHVPVVGDTASLISGGPCMTVCKITQASAGSPPTTPAVEASIECWWFCEQNGMHHLMKASFPPEVLEFDVADDAPE